MADRKITELTALTGANANDSDVFPIVDVSADETKKMTLGELKEAFDSGSGFVRITGDTMTGDLTVPNVIVSGNVDGRDVSVDGTKLDGIEAGADVTDTTNVAAAGAAMETGADFTGNVTFAGNTSYGDNDKAIFGAGSDLQIYHNSANNKSYIEESGAGNLVIRGSDIDILAGNGESAINVVQDGAVTLYHDSAAKLATTSTGVDITGTLTSDGLTVDGNVSVDGGTIKLDGNYPVGSSNTALGNGALNDSLTGQQNTAIGSASLAALTSGNDNTAVGRVSLSNNTTGGQNTAVGRYALSVSTTGSSNTALGAQALNSNTTANENTAVGYKALYSNTTGNDNVAVGWGALFSNTTTSAGTAVGRKALYSNTTGLHNVATGYQSLELNTTGSYNVAYGMQSLAKNTTGNNNTSVGYVSLYKNTTGSENSALGVGALYFTTTGSNNTALGRQALQNNTTASNNTAVGYQAGYSITTGNVNTAMGHRALYTNTTGYENTAIGPNSLKLTTTGLYNSAFGSGALLSHTTGSYNTAVGRYAGYHITTGGKNTILGCYNGNQGGLDIRTSSNHIVLSDGDGNPRMHIDNSGYVKAAGIYNYTTASSANVHVLSNGYLQRSTSSLRYKNTVNDATHGLTELLTLRPVTYKGNNDGDTVFGGLIAEEVHDAGLTEFVQYNDDGEPEALAYANMVSLCIKAIQQQQATITALTARITALENA